MGLPLTYAILNGVVKGPKICHRKIFVAQWEEAIPTQSHVLN